MIMYKAISLSLLVLAQVFSFSGKAQDKNAPLAGLLAQYYAVKNALVAGDAAAASKSAADFVAAVKSVDTKTLNVQEQAAFKNVQTKLLADAAAIAAGKDIAKQRSHFQGFSEAMVTLAKAARHSKPAFVAYCPMKKAQWLSAEQAIKNPYYGSSMLSCGKVTDTVQ